MLSSTFREIESTYGVFVHITLRLVCVSFFKFIVLSILVPKSYAQWPFMFLNQQLHILRRFSQNYFIPNHDHNVVDAYALEFCCLSIFCQGNYMHVIAAM